MRIWSLHPSYLDRQGLTACWRESLLAQAVLLERTRGYRSHPQLTRFRALPDPAGGIGAYLAGIADEAQRRGYSFNRSLVERSDPAARLTVPIGQAEFEWGHLMAKLRVRSPEQAVALSRRGQDAGPPLLHPMMLAVDGPVADWERP
ncbi:pyrimidine dimer DNA glycosylase/endonuclease V [Brevibacterium daeguense]|uniref:Pyrimidine dimer DNA glycosylase/endonuclease V n=1 Tax=Brevibacterium daeguense TaxID=909936 RepID=A0ABP8EIR0_9MICO|nr:pyrimidine dimer DNA glycosylase/endonuclease V [Brevibacterium daeguense]